MVVLRSINRNAFFLFECVLLIAGSISLGLLGEKTISTSLNFMSEPIIFSVSKTAILLFLANVTVLSVIFLRRVIIHQGQVNRFHAVLLNLSLAFGFVAFMSGQFMIRYIALDIVGLLVALIVLRSFAIRESFKNFAVIFQALRLGDLSLLASILLIYQYSGKLEISQMIQTATTLPISERAWVFFGFLFAVLVKSGTWPFDFWLRRVKNSASGSSFWLAGFLMPSLGYYLLYRVIPIITSNVSFGTITLISGLCFFFLSLFIPRIRSFPCNRFIQMGSVSNGFLLFAVVFISREYLGIYLLGLLIYRILLLLQEDIKSRVINFSVLVFPLIINGLLIGLDAVNASPCIIIMWLSLTGFWMYWDWRKFTGDPRKGDLIRAGTAPRYEEPVFSQKLSDFAQWLNRNLELNFFSSGIVKLGVFFTKITRWLYRNVEMNVFTLGFQNLSEWFNEAAALVQLHIEEGFEKSWVWLSKKFVQFSANAFDKFEVIPNEKSGELLNGALNSLRDYERIVLKKKLRRDLALIPLFLIVILVFLIIF